jgi:hypothetical protein
MSNGQHGYCGKWKVQCDHRNGRGYFDVSPFGTRDGDHFDAQGIRCPDACKSTSCRERIPDGDSDGKIARGPAASESREETMTFRSWRRERARAREEQQRRIEQERRNAALMAAATCHKGDTRGSPGVVHAWRLIENGEDRRGPAEGYPRGRIRFYGSYQCAKCGASKMDLTEWDEP